MPNQNKDDTAENSATDYRGVDVLIGTCGTRASLEQAMLSVLYQTYQPTRLVVVADGPSPMAREMYDRITRGWGGCLYYELPQKNGHNGDCCKQWWMNHGSAAAWIKFLDDDDWLCHTAVKTMMAHVTPTTSVVLCGMLVTHVTGDGTVRHSRVMHPALAVGSCGHGSAMVKTSSVRGWKYPPEPNNDIAMLEYAACHGDVVCVDHPLYWYNGWRDNSRRHYA